MSDRILIKGGTVLSMDRDVGNGAGLDVLIEGGRISEIGPSLRERGAMTIDAARSIVMPGFVDTHRHAWHSLLKNSGSDPERIGPAYTAEHVYAATLLSLLGAAAAGITTVVDWADVAVDRAWFEAATQAHADAGIRTAIVAASAGWDDRDRDVGALKSLRDATQGMGITVAYGPRSTGRFDAEMWEAVRGVGIRIHAHAGMQAASGGSVAALAATGSLNDEVTLVHCTHLDDHDLDAVATSGARVSITPASEMIGGMGLPPLQSFVDRSIKVGLGIGSESEAPGDLFAQMRAANSVQHASLFDLKLAGKAGVPSLLSTREVIRLATIQGAWVAGLDAMTGSLSPGKQADIVVLRTDRPNIAPMNDPIGAIVWGMDTSNIEWVFVGGRSVVRHGVVDADLSDVQARAIAARADLAAATRTGAGGHR